MGRMEAQRATLIISVMQPYFFPYIGYFQLIAQSDIFVFHDDVQYIKGGWVNRNRILERDGRAAWITLPIAAASHKLPIRERRYLLGEGNAERVLRKIESVYFKAPCFGEAFSLVREVMSFHDPNVAAFNVHLLKLVAERLGLRCRFVRSSELPKSPGLSGQARVIDICVCLGGTHYINPIGGTGLYEPEAFRKHGLSLGFLETLVEPLEGALPYLSIIDTLMREKIATIVDLLPRYRIISACLD